MITNVPVPFLLTQIEEYKYWKKCMTTYLESESLLEVIERTKTGDAKDSWRKTDMKALHAIQVSCSRDILDPILTKLDRRSAKERSNSAEERTISTEERTISISESFNSSKKEGTSAKKDIPSAKEVWNCLEDWACKSPKEEEKKYTRYNRLFKAISEGDWVGIEDFLMDQPEALTAKISKRDNTLLIDAVTAGHADVVKNLVNLMSEEDLEAKDADGYTALAAAAQGGDPEIAEILVTKNRKLLSVFEKKEKRNPLVIASENGHEKMTRYLYKQTRIEELRHKALVAVLSHCISRGTLFDIALDILQRRPKLLEKSFKEKQLSPLLVLSQIPSAFPSSSGVFGFSFLRKLLYDCIPVQSKNNASRNAHGDIESPDVVSTYPSTGTISAVSELYPRGFPWTFLFKVRGFEKMYNLKQRHHQSKVLLGVICEQIPHLDVSEFEDFGVYTSMFKAIKYGITEVFEKIIQCHPYIVWGALDGKGRNVLSYAILKRQENILNFISEKDKRKPILALLKDKNKNNILHQAAILSSSLQLDKKVTGAALQMQRELQWFKEVKMIAQPRCKFKPNKDGKNPDNLFTDQHKGLAKEGEQWAKGVASSCSVVATLIASMMFAVAFAVPGGINSETGKPLLFKNNLFTVFIISDALSLFSSVTSALVFLGILTSRYSEEAFLKSLPTTLIIGLGSLFFSILTMMVVYGTTLLIMLHENWGWVSIPIVLFACGPVFLYVLYQFPLLLEILMSTYGNNIFYRKKEE